MISKSHDHPKTISLRATLSDFQRAPGIKRCKRGVKLSPWLSEPSRGIVSLGTLRRVQDSGLDHEKAPGKMISHGGSRSRNVRLALRTGEPSSVCRLPWLVTVLVIVVVRHRFTALRGDVRSVGFRVPESICCVSRHDPSLPDTDSRSNARVRHTGFCRDSIGHR